MYLIALVYPVFCSCDPDLDSMTLKYELDLEDVVSVKVNFLGQDFQKLKHEHERQTHKLTRPNALPQPHSQVIITITRKCGDYSDVLPLKAARRDNISDLTSFRLQI